MVFEDPIRKIMENKEKGKSIKTVSFEHLKANIKQDIVKEGIESMGKKFDPLKQKFSHQGTKKHKIGGMSIHLHRGKDR